MCCTHKFHFNLKLMLHNYIYQTVRFDIQLSQHKNALGRVFIYCQFPIYYIDFISIIITAITSSKLSFPKLVSEVFLIKFISS